MAVLSAAVGLNLLCLLCLLLLMVAGREARADSAGIVTWIRPAGDEAGLLKVESAVPGVSARLGSLGKVNEQNPDAETDKPIQSLSELKEAHWLISPEGYLETPLRTADTDRISIRVKGLLAGAHTVFVRFHSKAKGAGQEWWEFSHVGLEVEGGDRASLSFDSKDLTLISGLGGYDTTTIWEREVGTAGSTQQPVTEVGLWIEKYMWTRICRIAAVRIETSPAIDYARTQDPGVENQRISSKLLANGPSDEEEQRAYGVKVVSPTLKIRPKFFRVGAFSRDDLYLDEFELADEVSLAAARGEYESRQVLVYSPARSLEKVELQASALRSADGGVIASGNILFAPVGFVSLNRPYDLWLNGWWPDPILPSFDAISVSQHDLQPFWYRVEVPRAAAPGTYTGTLMLQPQNAPAFTVPVSLEVWNFELPRMSYLLCRSCRAAKGGRHLS